MTTQLRLTWPDPALFAARAGRPIRLLALADEVDPALDAAVSREQLKPVELIVGCGDLPVDYLRFVTDTFNAPLLYVRGNHDVGGAWSSGEATGVHLPDPLPDGRPVTEGGLVVVGFNGVPWHGGSGLQRGELFYWRRSLAAWLSVRLRSPRGPGGRGQGRPLLVVTHTAPRGINDGPDRVHRGPAALRWLAGALRPALWLHGHTTLVVRRLEARSIERGGTLFYNCAGAVLVELVPPA
jgi:Icc-related predicted phosphoesterase